MKHACVPPLNYLLRPLRLLLLLTCATLGGAVADPATLAGSASLQGRASGPERREERLWQSVAEEMWAAPVIGLSGPGTHSTVSLDEDELVGLLARAPLEGTSKAKEASGDKHAF